MTLKHPPRPLLSWERIRLVGEPIAIVVAESDSQARDAVEKTEVEYRELPVIMDYYQSLVSSDQPAGVQ